MATPRTTQLKEGIYAGLDRAAKGKRIRWFFIKLHEAIGTALGAGNHDDEGERTGENRLIGTIGLLEPRPLLVDIGANNGSWTLEARARIPGSRVVAIEPGSQALGTLRARTERDPDVVILPIAIGPRNTTMELFGTDNPLQASIQPDILLRTTRAGNQLAHKEFIDVRDWATALEECRNLGIDLSREKIFAVKLDVEGMELEVMRQLTSWSGWSLVSMVQFEYHMHAIAQGQLISDFQQVLGSDFSLFRLSRHALISINELPPSSANYFGFSNWVGVRKSVENDFKAAFEKASGTMRRPREWRT